MSKTKFVVDGFVKNFHKDDAYWAADLVNETLQELFRKEYTHLGWLHGGLLDMKPQVDPGAHSWDFITVGGAGEAEYVSDNATDLVNIDLEANREFRGIVSIGCQIQYSELDVDRARMQSRNGLPFDLPALKAEEARYAHDKKMNETLAFGVPNQNVFGILNQPGIIVQDANVGNWETATSAQIQDDVRRARDFVIADSRGVERPTHCVVSHDILSLLQGRPWNDANSSNYSLLRYLEEGLDLKFVADDTMRYAGGPDAGDPDSGEEALLMYSKNPSKVFGCIPLMLKTLPPQYQGYVHKIPMRSRCGGVGAPRPRSLLRLEGI